MAGQGDEALLRSDVPAIHVLFRCAAQRTWIPGTRPGMTTWRDRAAPRMRMGTSARSKASSPRPAMTAEVRAWVAGTSKDALRALSGHDNVAFDRLGLDRRKNTGRTPMPLAYFV